MFVTPGSRATRRIAREVASTSLYTTSQSVTVPSWAHYAFVRLQGGGGGAKSSGSACTPGNAAAGCGAYLEKSIPVVPGATLSLTIGAGGSTAPTNGGTSTLTSGSMPISTLTCTGGAASTAASANVISSGGTATGGDINLGGNRGVLIGNDVQLNGMQLNGLLFSQSSVGVTQNLNGNLYGGGAIAASILSSIAGANGASGVCAITWYR